MGQTRMAAAAAAAAHSAPARRRGSSPDVAALSEASDLTPANLAVRRS